MIYLTIALALALAIFVRLYIRARRNNRELCLSSNSALRQMQAEYHALEEGRDEETEAYEQMYLSHSERIVGLENALEMADIVAAENQSEIDFHERHCLPWLQRMDLLQFDVHSLDEPTPIFDELAWGYTLSG